MKEKNAISPRLVKLKKHETTYGSEQIDPDAEATQRRLQSYLSGRFRLTMEADPNGMLDKVATFHGQKKLHVLPDIHTTAGGEVIRPELITSPDGEFISLPMVAAEGSFQEIGNAIEDELIRLPRNALELIEWHTGPLPNHVTKVPSVGIDNPQLQTPFFVSGMGKDTRFRDEILYYSLKDYRITPEAVWQLRAEQVRDRIVDMTDDKRYERFAIDTAPTDDWRVRLHRFKRDYARRMKALIQAHIVEPGVRVLNEDTDLPEGYVYREELDFKAPFDEVTKEIPHGAVDDLKSQILALREDYRRVILQVTELLPSDDDDDTYGEFMYHPDLADNAGQKVEGALVFISTAK